MKKALVEKYTPYPVVDLLDRRWPSRLIEKHPIWCSVDLRDGNQALETPMSVEEKVTLFGLLVRLGFREIEIGFPSASEVEFQFVRHLVQASLIPANVSVQVLVQARKHLIERTFEALAGAHDPIVHIYNSTSTLQREVVFNKSRHEIIALALQGIEWVQECSLKSNMPVRLEYSPESFTGTELEFSLEICNAVIEAWAPTPSNKMIINLPATVELSTPNIYADQIEWMSRHLARRDAIILSAHNHNDRGTAVAATELSLMAGAERVEGTLFGIGERTGNVDVVTLALNMYTQGVDPGLDLQDLEEARTVVEHVTRTRIHPRHPYVGHYVFTAFSGSHQDAIHKGLAHRKSNPSQKWGVPYLPIDPEDVGRTYENIIRLNSQSGKGGLGHVLETDHGLRLPKGMLLEFGRRIQTMADESGKEIDPAAVQSEFYREYVDVNGPLQLQTFTLTRLASSSRLSDCHVIFTHDDRTLECAGRGNGPIDACMHALRSHLERAVTVANYHEHSLLSGSDSSAICYIQLQDNGGGTAFGAGIDTDITTASAKAIFAALNRLE